MPTRFAHTNIIARDWDALARFYERVFGCRRAGTERDHRGEWIERATAIKGARIRGTHLAFPGHDGQGPTLEIFSYDANERAPAPALNREGLAHLALAVDDVAATLERFLAEGGSRLGEIVSREIPGAGTITLVYVRDPEGNIVELQSWR